MVDGNFLGQYISFPFLALLPAALLVDRGILVCHQHGRKHPSCARLAARRNTENPDRLERLAFACYLVSHA